MKISGVFFAAVFISSSLVGTSRSDDLTEEQKARFDAATQKLQEKQAAKEIEERIARLERRVTELQGENKQLREKLAQKEKSIEGAKVVKIESLEDAAMVQKNRIDELEAQLAAATTAHNKRIDDLEAQLSAAKSEFEPGNKLADADGYQEVSAKQIETLGERYVDKKVKLLNCKYGEASLDDTEYLPGVYIETVRSDGLRIVYDKKEREKWISFHLYDSQGTMFSYAFASKETMGDYLIAMQRRTRINIRGSVIQLKGGGDRYGIVCNKVERIPE